MSIYIELLYLISAGLFVFGLKMMSSPESARKGNFLSSVGMLLAIIGTLLNQGVVTFQWILVGILAGSAVGATSAMLVPMTAMPEMVALFNGFGGLASLLVAWEEYNAGDTSGLFGGITVFLAVLIGGVTFTGSVMAWAKLREFKVAGIKIGMPLLFKGQQFVNSLLLLAAVTGGIIFATNPAENYPVFLGIVVIALILGNMVVIPIGGADMPVVISLLNSYSGLAACAAGFVILNNILIVAGALVGASGIILTGIMCRAMNRKLTNVLFSGFGAAPTATGRSVAGEAKPISPEDTYLLLEAAGLVAVVPGYGMAVAQAQHAVRELGELLEKNGTEVRYAIHPVAGRMPGHMNVLLAEANVPYDQLVEMDNINPVIETVDVCLVIGANDVVNPSARDDETSPIYGMPIIEVDRAKTVIVLKRSMAAGFAGIDNPLFFKPNTRMLFGDAKASITRLIAEFKTA